MAAGSRSNRTPRLQASPLAVWERDGLKAALLKAGLPAGDIDDPRHLFWRFETFEDIPAGFGGLEIHGRDALLRSIVTLPRMRQLGMGGAIVAKLETEARAHGCVTIYLLTNSETDFFAGLGYATCKRDQMPDAIRESEHFASLGPPAGVAMVKRIG
jgi:N-acetylglutamate synthase-like GNAT family acetyltransferase